MRTRGEVLMYLSAATAVFDGFIGAFGIGFASAAAMTAGAASLPTPITEFDSDNWIYHRFYNILSPGAISGGAATDADVGGAVAAAVRWEIDSKAMRKVPDDDVGLYMAWEHTLTGTANLRIQARCRMLTKLS